MTKNNALVILLRVFGISALFALVAVFAPIDWMAGVHAWLGLGEMPSGPVVEYLARSVSAFYFLVGALFLVLASDVERYRGALGWLGILVAVTGALLTGIDVSASLPLWWTVVEGPATIGFGILLYWLAR